MLTLTQQPDQFTPSVLGRPLEFRIHHDALISQPKQVSTYTFTVSSVGQSGETFRLRGQDFATSSGQRYTTNSLRTDQQQFLAAFNLVGMLRSNPAFRDYSVRVIRPDAAAGQTDFTVIARRGEAVDDEPEASDNDVTGLTGISLAYLPGRSEVREQEQLFYRVYTEQEMLGRERFVPFDDTSTGKVDISSVARSVLAFDDPPAPDVTDPVWDDRALRKFSIRYGTYRRGEQSEGAVYGEVHESGAVPVMACLLQPWDTALLQPYGPNRAGRNDYSSGGAKLPWLTVRSNRRRCTRSGNEWTAIYLGDHSVYAGTNLRRIKRRFQRAEVIDGQKQFMEVREETEEIRRMGVLVVPTGGNAIPMDLEGTIDRLEVSIDHALGFTLWVQESELLTIDYKEASECASAELYLLEGLGSWATFAVEQVESRTIVLEGQTVSAPLRFNDNQGPVDAARPFQLGGTSRYLTRGRERITVRLGFIRGQTARLLESCIASPYGLLRFTDEVNDLDRYCRVLFEPGAFDVHRADGAQRLTVELEVTHELLLP
jgi:hypothetical protein